MSSHINYVVGALANCSAAKQGSYLHNDHNIRSFKFLFQSIYNFTLKPVSKISTATLKHKSINKFLGVLTLSCSLQKTGPIYTLFFLKDQLVVKSRQSTLSEVENTYKDISTSDPYTSIKVLIFFKADMHTSSSRWTTSFPGLCGKDARFNAHTALSHRVESLVKMHIFCLKFTLAHALYLLM